MAEVEARPLQVDKVIPDFTLPSIDGKQVSPREYRQRCNLVIAYLDLDRCGECIQFLKECADNYGVYRDLNAEILAVCPQPVPELQGKLGSAGLPFPVLSDQNREMAEIYLGGEEGGIPSAELFVTDRFGALRTTMVARTGADLPNQQSILDWLSLIELECPECSDEAPAEWGR